MFDKVPPSPAGCDHLRVIDCLSIVDYIAGDGHSIFSVSEILESTCSPEWLLELFAEDHESGNSYKDTIFVNGVPVKSLKGIYGLGLIGEIAGWFDITSQMGCRGFMCADYCHQLRELFKGVDSQTSIHSLQQTLQEAKGIASNV